MITAYLKNHRQSPRKVRLVASLVQGKKVADAVVTLDNVAKKAGAPLSKLLNSAISNAKTQNIPLESLYVKEFRVDGGVTLKRIMPRARGSASRINKRCSNVLVVLATKAIKTSSKTEAKPKVTKSVK
jgi:large subunit ribosomal protein L22